MTTPSTNHFVLPPDPLVEAHLKRKVEVDTWHKRVAEWQKTVDEPLDDLLPRYCEVWRLFRDAMTNHWPDGVQHILEPLRQVTACIRELESLRQIAKRWRCAGEFGHYGVPIWRLDWSSPLVPMPDRFHFEDFHYSGLPPSFLVAARILHLSFHSPDELLAPQLERLRILPGQSEVNIWFRFFETVLLPLPSKTRVLDPVTLTDTSREMLDQELQKYSETIPLPDPTERLTTDEIWEAANQGTWIIGDMKSAAFDGLRRGLLVRLGFEKGSNVEKSESVELPLQQFVKRDASDNETIVVKSQVSTKSTGSREKLIAALTKHHQYETGSCLNQEPIGNNELAKLAEVSTGTASAFFRKQFDGHSLYVTLCADRGKLLIALRILNNDITPKILTQQLPPSS
jgi:hypothetical protein